jgi:hypothetical protein
MFHATCQDIEELGEAFKRTSQEVDVMSIGVLEDDRLIVNLATSLKKKGQKLIKPIIYQVTG